MRRRRRRDRTRTQDGDAPREGQGRRDGGVRGGSEARGGGGKVDVVMWICRGAQGKGCGARSFMSRFKCHVCLRPRPRVLETAKETWNLDGLPANVALEYVHGPRPPPHRPHGQHDGARQPQPHAQGVRRPQPRQQQQQQQQDGPLGAGSRGPRQHHQHGSEVGGGDRGDEEDDVTGDELTFANIVRKTTRPKAKAKQAAKSQQPEQRPRQEPQRQQLEQDADDSAPPRPYQPPPLPRGLLAARTSALEAKLKEMQEGGAAGEGIKKAEARLESTRRMLKQAGGQTQRKLHFEMLEGDRRVARAVTAVEQAEHALGEAERELLAAVDKRDRAGAHLESERVKLTNARAHHAHLTLQAAAEVNAHSGKYVELHRGMVELRAALEGMQGMGAALDVLQQAANFFAAFAPTEYRPEDDPMLRDLDADGGQSEPTDLEAADEDEMVDDDHLHSLDAVAQAKADLDDLREQANQAAAGALRAVADRAAAIVEGGSTDTPSPSPATMVQQFAQRIQEAEARLEETKRHHALQQQLQQQPVGAAAAVDASSSGRAGSDAVEAEEVHEMPAAFASAARAAVIPLPPETATLPAAFATRIGAKPMGRCRWPQTERRFPPAEGGPRGRARSLGDERSSRKRSRSGPGRVEEQVDQQGDQVIGGDSD